MSSDSTTALRTTPRASTLPWLRLSYAAIGVIALLPRVWQLGAHVNIDEAMFWLRRSGIFLDALRAGDYAATAVSTHPGVTTMWLGSAGLLLRGWLFESGLVADQSFPMVLALTRLPLALTHTAAILLGYWLLRRLLAAAPAALAAVLWAADPFVIGYSRMLHVDGLSAAFATLSLLAACAYWNHGRQRSMLVISGMCAGLAILSKSPALVLLPAVGLTALLAAAKDQGRMTKDQSAIMRQQAFVFRLWSFLRPLAAWGTICLLTSIALWPALWVGSLRPFEQLQLGVVAEGAGTHVGGNFFLGREIEQPGALFYPVALALRLTPWAMIGVLALPLALRGASRPLRRDMAVLAGFAILFVAAMSVFSNKLNRYILPIIPALDILAAVGLLGIGDWGLGIGTRFRSRPPAASPRALMKAVLTSIVGVAAIANAAYWHPYGEAAFNQALGGAPAGARTFFFGTGEGMQLVAAWLNEQPDITGVVTISPMVPSLQPYLRRGAQAIDPLGGPLPEKAGYAVIYGRLAQRERMVAPFDQFYGRAAPLQVITIHGVDYAWIYQVPPAIQQPRPASFGPAIELRGLAGDSARRGQTLALKLSWNVRSRVAADYMLFAHLIGPDQRRYAQIDLPYPTSEWQPGRYPTSDLPIAIPADAPAGVYQLSIGLYDLSSGQRLPLSAADRLDPAIDGPDALLLTQFELK
jgi:4-amino-4-deoxy-L-arabinose transferase-like glycosyltransferase